MAQYKEIAGRINPDELGDFYSNHLPCETCKQFNIPTPYLLRQVLGYFNIPVHTAAENTRIEFDRMSAADKAARGQKISQSNMGREVPQEVRDKISRAQTGIPKPSSYNSSTSFKPGRTPWNKGSKGLTCWHDGQAEQRWNTMKANGHVGKFKTQVEKRVEQDLIQQYGQEHVHYQYKDPQRYPFFCDFYVDTEDLFIEVNNWWHHGPHPYDPDKVEDEDLLNEWRLKAESSPDKKQYQEAIRIWTIVDPLKMETAKKNHLNYKVIYKY